MEIIRIGLDLAKNVFEVCGVDMRDVVVLRKPCGATRSRSFLLSCRLA